MLQLRGRYFGGALKGIIMVPLRVWVARVVVTSPHLQPPPLGSATCLFPTEIPSSPGYSKIVSVEMPKLS